MLHNAVLVFHNLFHQINFKEYNYIRSLKNQYGSHKKHKLYLILIMLSTILKSKNIKRDIDKTQF
jgi:hypothetical protein